MLPSPSRFLVYFLALAGFQHLQTSSRSTEPAFLMAQSTQFTRPWSPRTDDFSDEIFTGGLMLRLRGGGEHSKSARSHVDTRKRASQSSKSSVKPFKKRSKKWKRKKRTLNNEETNGEHNEESSTAHVFDRDPSEQEPPPSGLAQASFISNRANASLGGGNLDSGTQV
jgi:hypothetical protein